MKISSWIKIWLVVAGMSICGLAQAQMVGLPLLDTATPREAGSLELTPGLSFGQDMDYYGLRTTVTVMDEMRAFFDLGYTDIAKDDGNVGLQGGVLYSLPPNDFIDLGVRSTMYYVSADYVGLTGLNAMLVFSDETLLDHLFFYGGAGLDLCYKDFETRWGSSSDTTELNPALSAGLAYEINEHCAVFTEVDYIDGWYVSGGVSIR